MLGRWKVVNLGRGELLDVGSRLGLGVKKESFRSKCVYEGGVL